MGGAGTAEADPAARAAPAPGEAAAAEGPLLEVRDVSLSFGGLDALKDVSFDVRPGELFSIIGPNGAGKTSLLNCLSGRYRPTGQILFAGRDLGRESINARARLGISRTFQNLALFEHMTVLENILVGRHHLLRKGFLAGALYWVGGALREEVAHRREIEGIIDFLEIEAVRHVPAGNLPYGIRKRVELARAIAARPRLILLDEPMAGMNLDEKEDMARFVLDLNEEWGMTVIMIEHDMGVVMDMSERVMALDFGEMVAVDAPAGIVEHPRVKQAYLGADA